MDTTSVESPAGDTAQRSLLPRWARVALTPFALVVAILVPSLLAGLVIGESEMQAMPLAYVVLCTAVSALSILIVWLLVTRVDRRPFRQIGLLATGASVPLLLLGLAVSAGIVIVVNCSLAAAGLSRNVTHASLAELGVALPGMLAAAFLLQGFPEELFFRGYVLSMFAQTPAKGIAVSALVFGVIHLISSGGQENLGERFLYLGPATAFGLLAACLVVVTRSLWAAVGVHAGFHVGTHFAYLIGSGDGPANWLGQTLGYVAASAVVLALGREHLREPIVIDR